MNSLSWLIYAIGAASALGPVLGAIWVAAWILGVLGLIAYTIGRFVQSEPTIDSTKWIEKTQPFLGKVVKCAISAIVVTGLLGALIPEQKYLIMIAASEVGQRVVESESGQKVVQEISGLSGEATELLRTYITTETKRLKNELVGEQPVNQTNTK